MEEYCKKTVSLSAMPLRRRQVQRMSSEMPESKFILQKDLHIIIVCEKKQELVLFDSEEGIGLYLKGTQEAPPRLALPPQKIVIKMNKAEKRKE